MFKGLNPEIFIGHCHLKFSIVTGRPQLWISSQRIIKVQCKIVIFFFGAIRSDIRARFVWYLKNYQEPPMFAQTKPFCFWYKSFSCSNTRIVAIVVGSLVILVFLVFSSSSAYPQPLLLFFLSTNILQKCSLRNASFYKHPPKVYFKECVFLQTSSKSVL